MGWNLQRTKTTRRRLCLHSCRNNNCRQVCEIVGQRYTHSLKNIGRKKHENVKTFFTAAAADFAAALAEKNFSAGFSFVAIRHASALLQSGANGNVFWKRRHEIPFLRQLSFAMAETAGKTLFFHWRWIRSVS